MPCGPLHRLADAAWRGRLATTRTYVQKPAPGDFSRAGESIGLAGLWENPGMAPSPSTSHEQARAMGPETELGTKWWQILNDLHYSQKEKRESSRCWPSFTVGRGTGCAFKSAVPSLLPGSWGHPRGFRREGDCCGGCDHISATAKASGACQWRSSQWQFSFELYGTTSEWKREPKPFDREALMRAQACHFLPSLISHQILPCIMHFFGANKVYFYVILMLID